VLTSRPKHSAHRGSELRLSHVATSSTWQPRGSRVAACRVATRGATWGARTAIRSRALPLSAAKCGGAAHLTVLGGTNGYSVVLGGTNGYSVVLGGTNGYSAVLGGTLRASGWSPSAATSVRLSDGHARRHAWESPADLQTVPGEYCSSTARAPREYNLSTRRVPVSTPRVPASRRECPSGTPQLLVD
jgi:hypothetical protein